MLPKQLKAQQIHLKKLLAQKVKLTDSQKQLLHELDFLDKSSIMEIEFDDYSYEETMLESFAVASTICPNCGKKY